MGLYEIYIPELDVIVKFKILSMEEGQIFCLDHEGSSTEDYKKAVLEHTVFNLKTDVAQRLREASREQGEHVLDQLYHAAIMLNPGMSFATWLNLTRSQKVPSTALEAVNKPRKTTKRTIAKAKLARSKFLNLERHLKERIIGQDEAIAEVVSALKRAHVGLQDVDRPLGVFLFAGASGIGKTYLAEELHKYLFDSKHDLVRVDCGEYQLKHDNQKLIGSPPGYFGHEEGGQLTNQVLANPDTVVLIDEVEKAHPDMINTFLRVFDKGMLTDSQGQQVSFRNAIIIMTTNLGNDKVVNSMLGKGVGFNQKLHTSTSEAQLPSRSWVVSKTEEDIRDFFKPELLNRVDKTVVFNHLTGSDYAKIADLELQVVQSKLSGLGHSIAYDSDVIDQMLSMGVNAVEGARKLNRVRRVNIEDELANLLLDETYPKGTVFQIIPSDTKFGVVALGTDRAKAKGVVA